jgi:hypothetical protein
MCNSDKQVKKLATWKLEDPMQETYAAWLNYAVELWDCDYGCVKRDGDTWTFVTGGWSENEYVIASMKKNWGLWACTWLSSHRGGKHCFDLR